MTAATLKHAVRRWRGHYHATLFTLYLTTAGPIILWARNSVLAVICISLETAIATHLAGWAADDAAPTPEELEEADV